MSWGDRFRPHRAEPEEAAAESNVADPNPFAPLIGVLYQSADEPIGGSFSALLFSPGGRVMTASAGPDNQLAAGEPSPSNSARWLGQYTAAGRFMLERHLERPVIFSVLDSNAEGFTARRTDTASRVTSTVRYVPTSPSPPVA